MISGLVLHNINGKGVGKEDDSSDESWNDVHPRAHDKRVSIDVTVNSRTVMVHELGGGDMFECLSTGFQN